MSDTNQDQIYIDEIARALSERRAAIMVGSGFSKNASPEFPDWKQLGFRIRERLYGSDINAASNADLDVLQLAEELTANHGRIALNEVIENLLQQKIIDLSLHEELLALDWTDVFTTNYDGLLERAAESFFPPKYKIVKNEQNLLLTQDDRRIIKLHGDKDDLSNCIITQEDYRTYPQKYPVFLNTVRQSLIENIFCLIGFSATDSNFLTWIGWIRDCFGEKLPQRIYLVGTKKPRPQWEKILENRNIIFVNIAKCIPVIDRSSTKAFDLSSNEYTTVSCLANAADKQKECTNKHYLPIKNFLAYLKKKSEPDQITERQPEKSGEDFSILWNIASSPYPNPQSDVLSECERIIKEWRQIRESYPGWVILPYRERNNLWTLTQQWRRLFYSNDFSKLSPELQYEFTCEIVWRINKCLSPIDDIVIQFCERMIINAEWKAKKTDKWFEVILTLLREYRTTRNEQKWNDLTETIQKECSRLSPEQWSAFCYEKSLNALFSVDTAKLRQTLDDWAEAKNAPLLEAKKAVLWAELGELEKAKTIVGNALETVREQQKSVPSDKQTVLFSQEGCILSIYRCIEHAESFVQRKYDNTRHRLDALRQYRCDITEEQLVFSTALKHEPVPPPTAITVKPSFDIGTVNYTQHLSNEEDKEMLLGYSYLIFAEETGIPFKLSNVNFDKDSAIGAAKRIKRYNFHWAFITLLRTSAVYEASTFTFFGVEDIAALKLEDSDYYASLCIDCLDSMQKDIAGLREPYWERNLAINYARVMPTILSRLCTKCSIDILHKILDYIVRIYDWPEKDKQAFLGVDELVMRFIMVCPASSMRDVFDKLKRIDYKSNDNSIISACGFIDPYLPFINRMIDIDNEFLSTKEDIEFALSLLETHRQQGIGLCLVLCKSFDEEQKQRCAKLLWDEKYIDIKTRFPQSDFVLSSAFLYVPAPNDINVLEQFKRYSLENVNGKDIFDDEKFYTAQTATNQFIGMPSGCSRMIQEWENTYCILSSEQIELNEKETQIIYNYIHTYWNNPKHKCNLREQSNPFFSKAGKFRARFQTLLRILAFVVIPNAVKNNEDVIKKDIDQLLMEMSEAGLNIGLAKVASLALCPERQSDTQTLVRQVFSRFNEQEIESVLIGLHVLLMMKHKDISFELDTHWAVGCIVEHIQNWLSPALECAMCDLADILATTPQFIEEKCIADILPVLDILVTETQLLNKESRIEKNDRLTCRKACMRLASTISKCDQYRDSEVPAEVQKWKDIAYSTDEFWEIRNEWK